MLKFNPAAFVTTINTYSDLSRELNHIPNLRQSLPDDVKFQFQEKLNETQAHCEAIGLDLSVVLIERIKGDLGGNYEGLRLKAACDELKQRILDEVETFPLLIGIKREKAEYFNRPNAFGVTVADQFPSSSLDIDEASKCFALGRYTACVMHLQRVMEVGLKAYGDHLGIMGFIQSPQPSWNIILDKTAKEIKERGDNNNQTKSWNSDHREKDFCESIQPFLLAVKIAWRNPSMHADKTYDEEYASDIFNAVKSFMRHLALHLDEEGKFN